jgi:uncharacterized Zn-binding protein involved in type VI secretion
VRKQATSTSTWIALRLLATILALMAPALAYAQTQTVTASWDANTDQYTSGYRLYWGTSPTALTNSADAGNNTSRPVTLATGTTYYFVVRGYNAVGAEGPPSNQAQITVSAPAPTATFTASLSGSNTASLNWTTTGATSVTINGTAVALQGPASYPISATTTYTLVATGPGGSVTRTATVNVPVVNCVVSAWTMQTATPWGACTAGQQTRTETWTRTIVTPPSGGGAACGPLSEQRTATRSCAAGLTATFTATLQGTNTAALNWQTTGATTVTINGSAVALSGSAHQVINAATTYTLVATGPGGSVTRVATVVPNAPPVDCVVSAWSLQSATPWGLCSGGQQSRSETWVRSVVTPPVNGGAACGPLQEERVATQACTAAPTAPGAPVNMRADVSGLTVTLSWGPDPTGGAPDAYLVSAGLSPGASNLASELPVGNVTSGSASLPHGVYYARVKAQNSLGTSADSAEVAFTIGTTRPPRQPGALTGSLQNGVATLSWSVPAHEDGASPTGYLIEAGSGPGLANLASVPVGNVTSIQAGSVPPGVYYVRVRAMNDMGLGDPSNEIVLRSAATVGAPQALTESGQDNVVQLNWQAPLTGDIPAGYVIEAGSGPGLVDIAALRLGNVLTFATTVPPGVAYVRIRAVGADGIAGEASNEIVVRR